MLNAKLKYNCFFVFISGKYAICPISLNIFTFISTSFSTSISTSISTLTSTFLSFEYVSKLISGSNLISRFLSVYTSISNSISTIFDFLKLKQIFRNAWLIINVGFIGTLYLNGLGLKSTRKKTEDKKHWRFNVGHSHVFKYYTPRDLIMKVKTRLIFFFGFNKVQIGDILHKLRSFHIPDAYKGVGLKFKDEVIRLKKGKTRQ